MLPAVGYSGINKKMFEDSKNNVESQQTGEPAVHVIHAFQDNVPLT
jgi:hypothetical protein